MSSNFNRDGQPLYPKPFIYLDLPKSANRTRPITHQSYRSGTLSGKLEADLRTLGPVHVGSGRLELSKLLTGLPPNAQRDYPLVRGFVRSGDKRVIPGSSLKGAVRSVTEAITASCVAKKSGRTFVSNGLRECRNKNELCPACRMFGALGFLGKVKFSDAVQAGEMAEVLRLPQMYRPQASDPEGRKFYQHGRKQATGDQPVEVVPAGQIFRFSLRFDNLEEAELGLLSLALGLASQAEYKLWLKLGGFKPACLGSVEVEPVRLLIETPSQSSVDYDDTGEEFLAGPALTTRFEKAINQARERRLVLSDQLVSLAATLKFPGDRDCPPGMY